MTTRWSYEAAIERSGLKPLTRLVLATIARNADAKTGMIPARYMPSAASLAARTGLSERRVRDHLKLAEEAGWIVIEQRPGRKSGLALTVPPAYAETPDAAPVTPDVPAFTPDGASDLTPDAPSDGSDLVVQSVKPQTKSSSPRETPCSSENIDVVVEDKMMMDLVISTIKYRTGKDIDVNRACLIAYDILSKAKDPVVLNPCKFVRAALVNAPDPQVFLPTYQPPPYRSRRQQEDDARFHRQMARAGAKEQRMGLGSQSYPDEAYNIGFDGKPLPSAQGRGRNEDPIPFGQLISGHVRRV